MRRIDGLALYRPMPLQQEFHESNAREKLIRGSNRSGKTTATAAEVARAVTGLDPRYPSEGICYVVGKDEKEVAQVMYKLLFRADAIKMIRDEQSGDWRSYMPDYDGHRKKEAKPAPPFIPKRLVRSIAWKDKKAGVPSLIVLHTGWEMHFFSSNALPPHGTQVDLVWFDEEILNQAWYAEMAARRVDRDGKFLWSATPQAGTVQLYELHERAEKEAFKPKAERRIEEFISLLSDNFHLTQAQKDDFEASLDPDDVMVRIHGEFAVHGTRVFPEFSVHRHVVPYLDILPHWTKYVAIDPGRQICAALFMAVPPPEESNHGYIFDELYIPQCTAEIFGQRMREHTRGFEVEAFIIDHQEGRKAETGSGVTVEDMYSAALKKHNVYCHRSGHNFTWGQADPEGGIEAVRSWLTPQDQGRPPRLQILQDKAPNFIFEMKRYWYETKKVGGQKIITDTPRSRGHVHLCACIRYIIQDDPVYVYPRERVAKPGAVWQKAQELMKDGKGKGKAINLGPGNFTIGIGCS